MDHATHRHPERRWVAEDENIETLSVAAATSALDRSGVARDQIDAVIVATISHYYQTPALAPKLAGLLGLGDVAAYDISAACAGFSYAVAQAEALVRGGQAHYVLVVAGETISDITDLTDRGTAFLFGDGAGAVVVGPSQTNGIGPVVWGSDGDQYDAIWMDQGIADAVASGTFPTIRMDGQAVFKWATSYIAQATRRCLDEAGITPDELDVFIPIRPTTESPTPCCATSSCLSTSWSHALSRRWATTQQPPFRWRWTPC